MRSLSGSCPASAVAVRSLHRGQGRRLPALLRRFMVAALIPLAGLALGFPTRAAGSQDGRERSAETAAWTGVAGGDSWQLSPRVLAAALDAAACARARGIAARQDLMTVIDYSLPSTAPRLWVLDLARHKVLFHELVAHGAGSGDNFATRFSNEPDSRQTSLGLFLTGGTYEGGNGYSLRLRGLEPGVNDLAAERNIVIHGAWYVSAEHASRYGRLGRSWGCPALPQEVAGTIIDTIKDGSFVFAYAAETAPSRASSADRACPMFSAGSAGSRDSVASGAAGGAGGSALAGAGKSSSR
jgi:hypothetical protein